MQAVAAAGWCPVLSHASLRVGPGGWRAPGNIPCGGGGGARFVDNVHLPRMLHGAFVRSPFAHAEIVAVDAARALAAGALAVLTAQDLPFNDQRWIVRYWHPSIRNGLPKFLAVDHVRF